MRYGLRTETRGGVVSVTEQTSKLFKGNEQGSAYLSVEKWRVAYMIHQELPRFLVHFVSPWFTVWGMHLPVFLRNPNQAFFRVETAKKRTELGNRAGIRD